MPDRLVPAALFTELSDHQIRTLDSLPEIYKKWNAKVNLVSRQDEDELMEHHIMHSLAIFKVFQIPQEAHVVDIGTGGGFPGIPLAILRPDCRFTLIDATAKKLMVVEQIADHIGLNNIRLIHGRAEHLNIRCDVLVCRAVAPLAKLWKWTSGYTNEDEKRAPLVALKGGDLDEEVSALTDTFKELRCHKTALYPILKDLYYKDKYALTLA